VGGLILVFVSFIRLSQDCGILFAIAMGPFDIAFAMGLAAMRPFAMGPFTQ
jgi:hypothetical protein